MSSEYEKYKTSLTNLDISKFAIVGRGSEGIVVQCKLKQLPDKSKPNDDSEYVVKILFRPEDLVQFRKRLEFQLYLESAFLTKLVCWAETESQVYLVRQRMTMNLRHYMKKYHHVGQEMIMSVHSLEALTTGTPLLEKLLILRAILYGLSYLHDKDIVHGHLKPENVLLSLSPCRSNSFAVTKPTVVTPPTTSSGKVGEVTPDWLAPFADLAEMISLKEVKLDDYNCYEIPTPYQQLHDSLKPDQCAGIYRGNIHYTPPEYFCNNIQLENSQAPSLIGTHSDMYCFGLLIYEILFNADIEQEFTAKQIWEGKQLQKESLLTKDQEEAKKLMRLAQDCCKPLPDSFSSTSKQDEKGEEVQRQLLSFLKKRPTVKESLHILDDALHSIRKKCLVTELEKRWSEKEKELLTRMDKGDIVTRFEKEIEELKKRQDQQLKEQQQKHKTEVQTMKSQYEKQLKDIQDRQQQQQQAVGKPLSSQADSAAMADEVLQLKQKIQALQSMSQTSSGSNLNVNAASTDDKTKQTISPSTSSSAINPTLSATTAANVATSGEDSSQKLKPLGNTSTSRLSDNALTEAVTVTDLKGIEVVKLRGHENGVVGLVILQDGRVFTGSYDQTGIVWNPQFGETGKIDLQLRGHIGYVSCICQLMDSRLVTSSVDKSIIIWDCKTGKNLQALRGHGGFVLCLCGLLDGNLCSGSRDKTLRVWNMAENGKCKFVLMGHTADVWCVTQLKDERIASGSADMTIRIWNLTTGKNEHVLKGHQGSVRGICALSDGVMMASVSTDRTLKLWDLKNGCQLARSFTGHVDDIYCVQQLADGRLITGSEDKMARIWNVQGGDSGKACELQLKNSAAVMAVGQLKDGRLAFALFDNTVAIWK